MNKKWIEFNDRLMLQRSRSVLPYSVTLELTPKCNFNCKMCYIHESEDDSVTNKVLLSKTDLIQLAKNAFELGVFHIGLTGGEIFTRSDLQAIYEEIYDMGVIVNLLTNAYLIKDSDIVWLKKRKPALMKISLYGASDETYWKACGVKDGFTVVSRNILKLKDAGIKLKITTTLTKDNYHDLEKIKGWVEMQGLEYAASTVLFQPVRGIEKDIDSIRIYPDISKEEIARYQTTKMPIAKSFNPFSKCRCYNNSCIISWDGRMIGCNFIDSISEDAMKDSFLTNFQRLWERLSKLKLPKECVECNFLTYCAPCAGRIAGESGDPEIISEYTCLIGKQRFLDYHRRQIYRNDELCD